MTPKNFWVGDNVYFDIEDEKEMSGTITFIDENAFCTIAGKNQLEYKRHISELR